MIDPYRFTLHLLQNIPPPLPHQPPDLCMFWRLTNYCDQNIPQLDDYRQCPPAHEKYAFFLPQNRTAVAISVSGDIQ